ncbi:MAG: ABC transporter ATP-binding protein [Deltaproteobacteria bacterium]|nr:ABC transporter ATP-binding protein [Deltaproteobacteria bacterium]
MKNVSLEVEPGEFLTLLGPSGCGKTTTLRMIAGFERPNRGRIFIGDEDVTDLMANQRNIGFVFQNYALFPHLNVFENVAYGLKVQEKSASEIERLVARVLELVGLATYAKQFPHQLSGGEQQRVALARAVVIEPRVLLFDEPLSNLDAKLRVYMRSEIRRLQKALAITAVYVTHDQEEAMAISDQIAVMNEGRIVQTGTAEELYLRPADAFVAQFIGRINTLPAKVLSTADGTVTLSLFGRSFNLPAPADCTAPGRTIQVFIRPEAITLTRERAGDLLPGVVVERTFLGEKADYLLEMDGGRISATAYDPLRHGTFAVGETIGVGIEPSVIHILREEEG